MKTHRPRIPTDAIDTNIKPWVLMDAPKELLATRSGVDPKGRNESWSHALLITRYLLVTLDLTIPRTRIDTLITGSNTRWLLGQIPLYWFLPDKLEFGLWHRTRNTQPATDVIIT